MLLFSPTLTTTGEDFLYGPAKWGESIPPSPGQENKLDLRGNTNPAVLSAGDAAGSQGAAKAWPLASGGPQGG